MSTKPMPGNQAPDLKLPLAGGGEYDLRGQSPEAATMVIFYRGLHCPICKDYLAEVAEKAPSFEEKGMPIVLASMDPADRAEQAGKEWGIGKLPVAYGLTEECARAWGLYITNSIKEAETPVFCEPGTFWVKPDNSLYLVEISSMPFARPDLDILLGRVAAVGAGYPARGARAAV